MRISLFLTCCERVLQNGGEVGEWRLVVLHSAGVHVDDGVVEIVLPAKFHGLVDVEATDVHPHQTRLQSLQTATPLQVVHQALQQRRRRPPQLLV